MDRSLRTKYGQLTWVVLPYNPRQVLPYISFPQTDFVLFFLILKNICWQDLFEEQLGFVWSCVIIKIYTLCLIAATPALPQPCRSALVSSLTSGPPSAFITFCFNLECFIRFDINFVPMRSPILLWLFSDWDYVRMDVNFYQIAPVLLGFTYTACQWDFLHAHSYVGL